MFGDAFIILFACVSLIVFVTTKNQTNESNKEDTAQHQVEDCRE